jgi:hypothetical protein
VRAGEAEQWRRTDPRSGVRGIDRVDVRRIGRQAGGLARQRRAAGDPETIAAAEAPRVGKELLAAAEKSLAEFS